MNLPTGTLLDRLPPELLSIVAGYEASIEDEGDSDERKMLNMAWVYLDEMPKASLCYGIGLIILFFLPPLLITELFFVMCDYIRHR